MFCEGGVAVVKLDFKAVRMCSPASGDAPSEASFILIRAGLLVRESFLLCAARARQSEKGRDGDPEKSEKDPGGMHRDGLRECVNICILYMIC